MASAHPSSSRSFFFISFFFAPSCETLPSYCCSRKGTTTPFLASPQPGLESARPQQLHLDSKSKIPIFRDPNLSQIIAVKAAGLVPLFPLAISSPTATQTKTANSPTLPTQVAYQLLSIPFCPLINHPCGLVLGRPRRLSNSNSSPPVTSHHQSRPILPPPAPNNPFSATAVTPVSFPSSPSPSSSNNLQSTNNKTPLCLAATDACEWPRTLDPPPFQSAREPRRLLPRQGEATPQTERQRAAHPRWRHRQQGPRWAISCSSSVSAGPSCPQQTIPICHEMSCGFRLWGRERGSWSVLTTGNWPRALLRIKRAQARRALALPPSVDFPPPLAYSHRGCATD